MIKRGMRYKLNKMKEKQTDLKFEIEKLNVYTVNEETKIKII